MKGLSTDTGTNWIGLLVLVYEGIRPMPEGMSKEILTGLVLTSIAIVAFATKGSGLNKEQANRIMNNADINDVLKKGRE